MLTVEKDQRLYGAPIDQLRPTNGGAMMQGAQLKAVPNGAIAQAVEGLRIEVRALTSVLDELESRLSPVLSRADDPRAASAPIPAPMPRSSELAECISEEVMMLFHAKARLTRLVQTLDI